MIFPVSRNEFFFVFFKEPVKFTFKIKNGLVMLYNICQFQNILKYGYPSLNTDGETDR